ncbi:hypothetical protein [Sinorhizobium meliloti]|uniref:hypothetical protein n=1 Tax=Rhizobium meliloti TaxID=382 RepID=UPI0012BC24CE|nr:hypothetical protein [Sinorhizobium meliloti]UFX12771.1 hypothetical protein SmelRRI128_32885 [Sinorhizobium meliloti]
MLKLNLQRSGQSFSRSKPRHCAIAHLACDEIEKAFTKDKIGTPTVAEKLLAWGTKKCVLRRPDERGCTGIVHCYDIQAEFRCDFRHIGNTARIGRATRDNDDITLSNCARASATPERGASRRETSLRNIPSP